GRLRQIITNLMGNAIKFTHAGEVGIHVRLDAESATDAVLRFEIKDTGIGIPEDRQSALFTAFTQADGSTTRKYGGTGLGLTISKQLAELMGGKIGFVSNEGKGSTFWFTAHFEKQTKTEHKHHAALPFEASSVRILVVDDNTTNRRLMAALLSAWGFSYEMAEDGATALQLLREAKRQNKPFHMALLDQQMPGMDGNELGRRIMADPELESTLMIMVTSVGQRGDAAELEKIGFVGFLSKPVHKTHLHTCIQLALARAAGDEPETGIITRHSVAESEKRGRGIRILLADDNVVNQKVTQAMLSRLGYSVDVVADGREAVNALQLIDYDLVLMDCQMPEMDGYEATTIIRNASSKVLNHEVPVIAMTANAMTGDREKCLVAGMTDYLSKPIAISELQSKLEQISEYSDAKPPVSLSATDAGHASQVLPDEVKVLDSQAALRMLDDSMSTLLMMLPIVLEQLRTNRLEISQAVNDKDIKRVKTASHRLKGSVGQIGATQSYQLCALLEAAAARGDASVFDELQQKLAEALDALEPAIEAFLVEHLSEAC
ncbi:MAG: response regulator, partial [Betaproteobacteria bacterium]